MVDRKDLDYQTMKEFNAFKKDSVDVTDNTNSLVKQLTDDTKLVLTTIQKLNNAVSKARHEKRLAHLQHKKLVFIFDECHRSQFGKTHGIIIFEAQVGLLEVNSPCPQFPADQINCTLFLKASAIKKKLKCQPITLKHSPKIPIYLIVISSFITYIYYLNIFTPPTPYNFPHEIKSFTIL